VRGTSVPGAAQLTHLERLEAESIFIIREVVSQSERPVMLYSIGKDFAVMLHLGRMAFYPSTPPFPLLHVDTTWKFKVMYAMRDRAAAEAGMQLLVYQNPEAVARGINPTKQCSPATLLAPACGADRIGDRRGADISGQRQHTGAPGGKDLRTEFDRGRHHIDR
jgi:sulfate adenylyltransferase subunit 2